MDDHAETGVDAYGRLPQFLQSVQDNLAGGRIGAIRRCGRA